MGNFYLCNLKKYFCRHSSWLACVCLVNIRQVPRECELVMLRILPAMVSEEVCKRWCGNDQWGSGKMAEMMGALGIAFWAGEGGKALQYRGSEGSEALLLLQVCNFSPSDSGISPVLQRGMVTRGFPSDCQKLPDNLGSSHCASTEKCCWWTPL